MADNEMGIEAIVGWWDFRNGNVCEFAPEGNVMLRGQRIGIVRHDVGAKFMLVYLRGCFCGFSDPLVLGDDGKSMHGFDAGHTHVGKNEIHRVENAETPNQDADPIVGTWDLNNKSNVFEFTEDGWVYCCAYRIGIWFHESQRNYQLAYLKGYFDGCSDPLLLKPDGTIDCLSADNKTDVLLRVENDNSASCE